MMTSAELHCFLEEHLGEPISLRLNDNVHSMVSVRRPKGDPARASVHRIFLDAPAPVLRALVQFLKRPTPASRKVLRQFIVNHQGAGESGCGEKEKAGRAESASRLRTPAAAGACGGVLSHPSSASPRGFAAAGARGLPQSRPPHAPVAVDDGESAQGRHVNLEPIARRLNREYFKGKLKFRVAWGRRPVKPPSRQRTLQLGLWLKDRRLIRVHPALDSAEVPRFFIEYIIYHEMCHIVTPHRVDEAGRICHHHRGFHELEQQFPDYERAEQWLQTHINWLLARYCSRIPERQAIQLTLF